MNMETSRCHNGGWWGGIEAPDDDGGGGDGSVCVGGKRNRTLNHAGQVLYLCVTAPLDY